MIEAAGRFNAALGAKARSDELAGAEAVDDSMVEDDSLVKDGRLTVAACGTCAEREAAFAFGVVIRMFF